ncbi:hypothetical protein BD413DRAFT_719149 [Trametes elegans]|nr:hypothetical protein BD413DRAFT_719149 [Trametes elegans]
MNQPDTDNTWHCPYCPYVQLNKRGPDFRRHVETHSQAALWVCCGALPENLRAREGVPREVLSRPPIEFEPGLLLVGGCKKTFSRRDSLQRHLRKNEGRCFSDDRAPYQPGNRLAAR